MLLSYSSTAAGKALSQHWKILFQNPAPKRPTVTYILTAN